MLRLLRLGLGVGLTGGVGVGGRVLRDLCLRGGGLGLVSSTGASSAGAAVSSTGAAFGRQRCVLDDFTFGVTGSSTSSICTMEALSPLRKPSFVMRV